MLIVLSQKIDVKSAYSDELFNSYHYPARYRNQIHKGDTFIYYQGNRYAKEQRYYFGVGTIGEILSTDGENYYAKLVNCQRFEHNVSIYLPDGGYIEQLGYQSIRNSINPPWQSSIRPLSQDAFDYILNAAGIQRNPQGVQSVEDLNDKLKASIREYLVGAYPSAIHRIESIAAAISRTTNITEVDDSTHYTPSVSPSERFSLLLDYCKSMKMSYSYKPVLILALMQVGKHGHISIKKAAEYAYDFYSERKAKGLPAEKRKCIYLRGDVTLQQIEANLIANPVKALCESGFFFYNEDDRQFSMSPEIWKHLDRGCKSTITRICHHKLSEYYNE